MRFTLGFSPCPNDTFIFDALVNKKIDTEGLDFEVFLEDVQTLNQWAMQGKLDISKISYGVLPLVLHQYRLLEAGGALGKGVGPLLISREPRPLTTINTSTIAIPGQQTTAHLLFSLAFPEAKQKEFMVFSDIEDAVLSGKVDCGVIIHENRFTYQQKGLTKLMDLGEFWEKETGAPIPLGGIVFREDLDQALSKKVNALIRKSLEYAFSHYPALSDYVKAHAQEMDESVMRQHIDLYVNNYSLSLGNEGEKAIQTLLTTYGKIHKNKPAATPLEIVH
ncbi:MAG TPA: 1,4-dihydroxy-6-naphthoate synthase [Puia sp.]|jgi:1,4-dihydroxy-6-naphthoate synthase|nr:1,4-dihydroxy-6-naphthoate synthase [Puia sp.]